MPEPVKSRPYRSPVREERARRTRAAVLAAARSHFVARGYAATTVAEIAATAGVAVDTVYTAAGTKPAILRLLVETAISGTDEVVPAQEREYVHRMRAEPRAAAMLTIYAAAVRSIGERLGPIHLVLHDAALHDPELARLRDEISARRAANMRLLAQELARTGDLRPELDVEDVADVIWTMNSPEYHRLLVHERGWSGDRFEEWLARSWQRLFLAAAP